jgi:hypothetical protein
MWSNLAVQLTVAVMLGRDQPITAVPAIPHSLGTHAHITSKVVEYTLANGLACPDAARARTVLDSLLQIGTLHEDDWTESTDSVRAQIKRQFGQDVPNDVLLRLGQTLILGRFNFHFTPRLTDGGVDAQCSSLQWAFGTEPCAYTSLVPEMLIGGAPNLKKVTVTLQNRFSWNAAVAQAKQPAGNTGFAQGFASLGYVLHLLEDLTSPAHSRNDAHAWTDPEWMEYRLPAGLEEEWGELKKLSGLPEMVRTPGMPIASPLGAESIEPIALFRALHSHVSSNFYSKSTVKFGASGPIANASLAYSCASAKGLTWANYICDGGGRVIAKGNLPITRIAGNTTSFPTAVWIDEWVADEQWKELGPLVVRYGSRLLMLYARSASPTMPCTIR